MPLSGEIAVQMLTAFSNNSKYTKEEENLSPLHLGTSKSSPLCIEVKRDGLSHKKLSSQLHTNVIVALIICFVEGLPSSSLIKTFKFLQVLKATV